MSYDQFEYYYPMPDDVAQTILMAETEPEIRLRVQDQNSKRVWLFNKILKNLLTGRRMLIVADTSTDIQMLDDFFTRHDIRPLAFFFQHSRSNIEKKLKEFRPTIVNGGLTHQKYRGALAALRNSFEAVNQSLISLSPKEAGKRQQLVHLILRCMKLRKMCGKYLGLIPDDLISLSLKELHELKEKVNEAVKLSAGNDIGLRTLQMIKTDLLQMSDVDEAWHAVEQHIVIASETIEHLLLQHLQKKHLRIYKDTLKLQESAIKIFRRIKHLQNTDIKSTEEEVQMELLTVKLSEILKEACCETDISDRNQLDSLRENDILKWTETQASNNYRCLSTIPDKPNGTFGEIESVNDPLSASYDLLCKQSILKLPLLSSGHADIIINELKSLYIQLSHIRKLKPFFKIFHEWETFLSGCTEQQGNHLRALSCIPPDYWNVVIEWQMAEKALLQQNLHDTEEYQTRASDFALSLENYRTLINSEIRSVHEKIQHKGIESLISKDAEFHKLFIGHENSDYTLSHFYTQLPNLSSVFPVIVLEQIREDYFPSTEREVWDEAIFLNTASYQINRDKITKACRHNIYLCEDPSVSEKISLAITQTAPDHINGCLVPENRTNPKSAGSLANFIFNNNPAFLALINNKELILSFMPEEFTYFAMRLTGIQYNVFQLSDNRDLDRLQDWFNYPATRKTFWTLDGITEPGQKSMQQYGWQKHFTKCLRKAGFEHIDFSTSSLLDCHSWWTYPDNQLFNTMESLHYSLKTKDH